MVKVFPLPVAPLQSSQDYVPSTADAMYQHAQWAASSMDLVCDLLCSVCKQLTMTLSIEANNSDALQAIMPKSLIEGLWSKAAKLQSKYSLYSLGSRCKSSQQKHYLLCQDAAVVPFQHRIHTACSQPDMLETG